MCGGVNRRVHAWGVEEGVKQRVNRCGPPPHLCTSMEASEGVGQKMEVHVTRMSMSDGFMRSFSSSSETAPLLYVRDMGGTGLRKGHMGGTGYFSSSSETAPLLRKEGGGSMACGWDWGAEEFRDSAAPAYVCNMGTHML